MCFRSEKESVLKGKILFLWGAIFFSFLNRPFQKQNNFDRVARRDIWGDLIKRYVSLGIVKHGK